MKRFTDTDNWRKRWFQELPPEEKLALIYIRDNCDSVGVWPVNVGLAEFQIGGKVNWDHLFTVQEAGLIDIGGDRWWLSGFCRDQYAELSEESTSKPIMSYIDQLKKHGLWEGYTKGIHTLKEKEKEKDQEKDQEKEPKKKKKPYGTYGYVKLTDEERRKLDEIFVDAEYWISLVDNQAETNPKYRKYSNWYQTILNWSEKEFNRNSPRAARRQVGGDFSKGFSEKGGEPEWLKRQETSSV